MLNKKEPIVEDIAFFEDEIDVAISEEDLLEAEKSLSDTEDYFEPIDTTIDYSDIAPSPEEEDIDADDMIEAEREIEFDPFEDDEVIDTAINADDSVFDMDEEIAIDVEGEL